MKTIATILAAILMICISCSRPYIAPAPKIMPNENNSKTLDTLIATINFLKNKPKGNFTLSNFKLKEIEALNAFGDTVILYDELIDLFNPDKFSCGLSEKIRASLNKSKRENYDKSGFIPDLVVNNTSKFKKAVKLDGRGANVLVHYFTYEMADKKESKPITSVGTPTQMNFNTVNWVDNKNDSYDNFLFTMDCAGYFSASAKVAAKGGFLGFGKIEVEAEGANTINQSQSILVMRVLIYSPLYAAYTGQSLYYIGDNTDVAAKKEILNNRIQTLQGIIDAIPNIDQVDTRRVYLNANYEAIITSNKGNSGYNGTGKLNSNIEINFVVGQATGDAQGSNSVNRKSSYSSYNTYILMVNKDANVSNLTYKDLKNKIAELKAQLK